MSKKNRSRGDPVGGGSGRRLRSQTLVRRSPRFLTQKKGKSRISEKPSSKKKPKKPSAAKAHLKSSPFSPDSKEIASIRETPVEFSSESRKKASETHLRSPPFSPDLNETGLTRKTQHGCFTGSQKKPSRSIKTQKGPSAGEVEASQRRRRSPRFASNLFEVMREEDDSVLPGSVDGSQSRRRSPRFASSSAEVVKRVSGLGVAEVLQKESDSAPSGGVNVSQRRRRSPSFASNLFEVMPEEHDSVLPCSVDGSQSRRRSPRFASNSAEVVQRVSGLGVAEVVRKESDSAPTGGVNVSQRGRRSPRFASNLFEVMREEDDSVLPGSVDGSQSRRRSHRFASNSTKVTKKKTLSDLVEVMQKEDDSALTGALDLSQSRRRSPRLVSNSTEAAKRKADLGTAGMVDRAQSRRSPRLAPTSAEAKKNEAISEVNYVEKMVKQRRRPVKLAGSSKIEGEMEVGTSELEGEKVNTERIRERKGSPMVLANVEGAEKKARKRGRNIESQIETERGQTEQGIGLEGWTREQEMALRRAYLLAKPSPHFWKKVSKMVPGKSAHECFDRIHANLPTPPQPQPRSRANRTNFSPLGSFSLSDSKSAELTVQKARRQRSSKQKTLAAQKTVRHLLRKHCLTDRSQEADHFSVLETSPFSLALEFPEIKSPATPDCILNPPSFLQKCSERSLSAHKSVLSRFKEKQAKRLSPEVLKRIKNMALHEKYIDHLHCREAKRKTGAKTANSVTGKHSKISSELGAGVLKAARAALISEARDAISHFNHMQANPLGDHEGFDTDDDDDDANTDECDDGDE